MTKNEMLDLILELRSAILAYDPCNVDDCCGSEACDKMRRALDASAKIDREPTVEIRVVAN